jgi:hypothetical protein
VEAKELSCWKCGASLEGVPLPIGRLAECLSCRAELHVCRQCEFYDTSVAQHCREPIAEHVNEKTRANFCAHFQPTASAFAAQAPVAGTDALEALFGGSSPAAGATGEAGKDQAETLSAEEAARRRLDALFDGEPDAD